ncbi:dynactin [Colletotrichum karsti]|uniref:Dynactin n=1 Tax=Colletotrichum karsti TaxID=1095194 RepID=A0A9P6HTA1_9PEZI|nr:dynactin [Colletotrichum karsti]KAF9870507.1 dynactin [Colletotrichum karsti]
MSDLVVGQTVRLSDGRTGVVRFVGSTHFASGDWVGIELEDDSGKNDGSVQGERYFDCGMGHGMFVRPTTLAIIAQAPATAKPAARRPSRPTSFNPGTGRSQTDSGLTKRMSLNAPSPSPGPKGSRPSSITNQITNKTARIGHIEYRTIKNNHTI